MSTIPVLATIPTLSFEQGKPEIIDLNHYVIVDGETPFTLELRGTLPAGVTFNAADHTLVYDGVGDLASVDGFQLVVGYPDPAPTPDPTPDPTPTPTPSPEGTWVKVGIEGSTIAITGPTTVRYGANGSYLTKTVSTSFQATNEFFGGDPAIGLVKSVEMLEASTAPTPDPTPVPTPMPTLVSKEITIGVFGDARALLVDLANIYWQWSDSRGVITSAGKGATRNAAGDIVITVQTALAPGKTGLLFVDNYVGTNVATFFSMGGPRKVP